MEHENHTNDSTVASAGGCVTDSDVMDASVTASESAASRLSMDLSSDGVYGHHLSLPRNGRPEVNEMFDGSVASGGALSMSTLISNKGSMNSGSGLAMVPVHPACINTVDNIPCYSIGGNPVFNTMQSNTVHHDYILPLSLMRYSLESEVALYNEEEKNMEHRDKEFELWLAHQMEKYEYIIEDLREVKREGNKGDKQVMVGNYVIL